jgi:DNA-binding response OmpR family regulator
MMTRILIVEDEPSLSEPLAFLLGREGYETARRRSPNSTATAAT